MISDIATLISAAALFVAFAFSAIAIFYAVLCMAHTTISFVGLVFRRILQ